MAPIPRPEMPTWWRPTSCGTLNLSHPLTRHCFPVDGSHHHVCCTKIPLPDEEEDSSLSESTEVLVRSIRLASRPASYSWCTCTQVICTELLGGMVSWDQHTMTRSRYYQDQVSKGFNFIGWEWLVEGIDALQELSSHPLPEDDPELRDLASWGLSADPAEGGQSGGVSEEAFTFCDRKRCPLGPRPALRKQQQQQQPPPPPHLQRLRRQHMQPPQQQGEEVPTASPTTSPQHISHLQHAAAAATANAGAVAGAGGALENPKSLTDLSKVRELLWGPDEEADL